MRVYETEGIDYDFSFDGLDGVDYDGYCARGELFEGLLGVYVDGGEPAAETGMGVVPAYYCFVASGLAKHIHHFGLKDGIDGFNGDAGTALGHCEDVDYSDGIVVHEFA